PERQGRAQEPTTPRRRVPEAQGETSEGGDDQSALARSARRDRGSAAPRAALGGRRGPASCGPAVVLRRARLRLRARRGVAQRRLPLAGVAVDPLALDPLGAALGELAAGARVADQLCQRGVPVVVGDEPAALLLAHAEVGADRRGEPREPGGRVLL